MTDFNDIDVIYEEKIRTQWLILFSIYFAFNFFETIVRSLDLEAIKELTVSQGQFSALRMIVLSSLTVLIPDFLITYYCSYRKKGTAWLMFLIVVVPVGLVVKFFRLEANDFYQLLYGISSLIGVVYWIACIRLRRVNAKWEYQKVLALKAKFGEEADGF